MSNLLWVAGGVVLGGAAVAGWFMWAFKDTYR